MSYNISIMDTCEKTIAVTMVGDVRWPQEVKAPKEIICTGTGQQSKKAINAYQVRGRDNGI